MLTRTRAAFAREDGVGLVEVLVAISLTMVVGGIALSSLVQGMRATTSTQTRFDAVASLQKSVDRMSTTLRAGVPPVVSVGNSNTAMVEVWDAAMVNKIRYTYTYCPGTRVIRARREAATAPANPISCTTPGDAAVLIDRVTNGQTDGAAGPIPVFTYVRSNGATATVAADVAQINIAVRRSMPGQASIRVNTSVRLRNAR